MSFLQALLLVTFARGQSSCPAGMYPAWGETRCCTSKCGPGTKIAQSCTHNDPDNTVCEACGPEYYNPYPDQLHCRRKNLCDSDNEEVKVLGNSTVNNQCQCQIGFFYRVSEVCMSGPLCPPGRGATRTGQCEPCPHGTFSNLTSHVQPCIPWQSCGMLGFLQHRPGTSTSDAVCISHPIDVFLPTEQPVINAVTYKDDGNNTDNITGERQPTALEPKYIIIIGVCVGAVLVLVVFLVVCLCRRETEQHIDLEDGQHDESKTPLGIQDAEDVNSQQKDPDVVQNMELEPLTGDYRQPTEEEGRQAAVPPDDGVETGDDSSMSDSLSTLSREGGAEPNSDAEQTDPKLRFSTMQYSNLIGVDMETTNYIEDHLGNMYLELATRLPLRHGCSFTKTDLDSLRHTYAFYSLKEAIRDTVNTWRIKQGEEASLEGLLVGLTACGKDDMVRDLCRMNNARRPNKGKATATAV
ncbi:PREDICTED: uncharacterized protein LOC109470118 [Branchiostoma belcheri]|uniref:Uncharacterized protein LOC109470118 n=1 Tax=Branchiostoma belcheri TaxID=7741 RepID=A0A6P4Y620_BRABE|nr:PREDICTED: uncharacterized protein LOC109470118 [Branchiostoma belcheri]